MQTLRDSPTAGKSNAVTFIELEYGDGLRAFWGREAWALNELIQAGDSGITAINYPGVRLADTVFKLRQAGLDIRTERVRHDGPFSGNHGRYKLVTSVRVLRAEHRCKKGGAQ